VLCLLAQLPRTRRLGVVLGLALAGTISIYGGQLNWMGMPAAYGVGAGANLVMGWLLAFSLIDRVVLGRQRLLSQDTQ
jgi:hypothetical protein